MGTAREFRRLCDNSGLYPFCPPPGIYHERFTTQTTAISGVRVGSSAHAAGVTPATKLIAVNGQRFTLDILREAIQAAKNSADPSSYW
jgi:hypothetical protein